ncbi:MAG: RNB domain-containing ribonuclease, partial [Planctomycetota bacterium]
RRVRNGMLHLDLPETELVLDKSGRVVDARPADDSYPHTMIEMFMVEANDAVASLLDRLKAAFMRRIHPEPDVMSLKNLAQLVRAFGYNLPRNPDRSAVQDLLDVVKGADCSLAVNLAVLRSFEKAQYAPLHVGHFALASTHYCHFTSPIRRYADLLVHRLLEKYLQSGSCPRVAEEDLVETGKHITFTEQRADDAERELTAVLILQMLSSHIGDELDCVVTGLTNFGVFVRCRKYGIEGLVRTGDLGADQWKFEHKAHCITGVRTGYTIRLGQAMTVRIVSVNIPARQLNVIPAEELIGKSSQSTAAKKAKKTRGRRQARGKKRKR